MRSIHIRTATAKDADAISSLLENAFEQYRSLYTPEDFAATTPPPDQVQKRFDEGPVWVAIQDNVIVGTISGIPMKELFYIRGMGVNPAARKLGIAHALLQHAEDYANQNGFKILSLSTTPFLADAIRLYERAGFRFATEIPPDLFGTPLLKMWKELR